MFDLFTIALFQLATIFGYTPEQPNANDTTPKTETGTVGSGGWGHDIQTPPPPPANSQVTETVGSGGWGHD